MFRKTVIVTLLLLCVSASVDAKDCGVPPPNEAITLEKAAWLVCSYAPTIDKLNVRRELQKKVGDDLRQAIANDDGKKPEELQLAKDLLDRSDRLEAKYLEYQQELTRATNSGSFTRSEEYSAWLIADLKKFLQDNNDVVVRFQRSNN